MSMTALTLALAAGLAAPEDKPAADPVKAEVKKMEGTWRFEKISQNGEDGPPADELKEMRLVIEGTNRTVMRGDEAVVKSTYAIDPKASPKTIDVEITDGPLKGRTLHGIYALDGDTFTTCLSLEGKDRPKKLEAAEGTVFQVLKRAKADGGKK